jgi:uncharacterized protein YbjT (DUF2867 family)
MACSEQPSFACVVEADLPRDPVGVDDVFAAQGDAGEAATLEARGVHQLVGELTQVVVVGGRLGQAAGLLPGGAARELQGEREGAGGLAAAAQAYAEADDQVEEGGATGSLGGKVVDELLKRGKNVRALVRPATDASRLEKRGAEIVRGDMLDLDSLVAAMNGADAVITTAAGYTRGGKNAHDIDTVGNANLAEAAHRTGIRRFVLTSILTSDQTPQVPHFWHKKVAEDKLEQLGVPFGALRPGAFLDQIATMAGNPIDKGRLMWIGKTTVPLTFVHTSDLATYLAAAVDAEADNGERIDIGWDRPVSMREMVGLMGNRAERKIKVWAVPSAVARAAGAVAGRFMPLVKDMAAMFSWFDTGRYVADTRRQEQLFGPVPTADDVLGRYTDELGTAQHR